MLLCYSLQKLLTRKNCLIHSVPNHNTHTQNPQKPASVLPCSSGPYATAGPITITLWRTPTKLMGNPDLPLLNTPIKAICVIFITFCEISTVLDWSKLIDVSTIHCRCCIFINWREVWPWNRWMQFHGRANSNCFCVTRKIQTLLYLNSTWQR